MLLSNTGQSQSQSMCALERINTSLLSGVLQFVWNRVHKVSNNILNSHMTVTQWQKHAGLPVTVNTLHKLCAGSEHFSCLSKGYHHMLMQHWSGAENMGPSDLPFNEHTEREERRLQEDLLTVTILRDRSLTLKRHNMKPSLMVPSQSQSMPSCTCNRTQKSI